MKITGISWLADIIEKIESKHNVQRQEVIEVFANRPHIRFVEKGHRVDENLYAVLGQTNDGRYLIVYFVHKLDKRALIVSAREMTRVERRLYEKR